jgi:glutamyl-Q tRNA(Asp) synthetase
VRGSDLLDTTARQIFLQQSLGCPTPTYSHIPVITNSQGQKFSKQNHAPALIEKDATANLRKALQFLQQGEPPSELVSPAAILNFASHNWALKSVPAVMSIASTAKISSC